MLTGDKTPATLERLKEELADAEDDLVTGNAEIASRQAVPGGRIAALRAVRLRARVRDRRADAGAGADPLGRLQVGRALPAARARARHEVARRSPPPTARWSTSRSRRASRRRSWPCSITSAGLRRARRRRCRSDSENEHTYLRRQGRLRGGRHVARRGAVLRHRSAVALLRGGALLPRPHPGAPAGTTRRRAAILCEIVEQVDQRPLHLLHRRPLLRHQGSRVPRARPHRARAGEVRRRLLLLLPRPRGLGAPARRAVRGVLVDVPDGRVRGGERVPRGVRPLVRQDAARARRAAAARDDRPQVVPLRRGARDAGQAGQDLRPDARSRSRRCSRIPGSASRSTAACSASGRSRRRAIRSSSCSRSTRASSSSTTTSSRSIARPG